MKLPRMSLRTIALLWLVSAFLPPIVEAAENNSEKSPGMIGVKECAACHSNPSPIYQQLEVTRFVRLVEATEWLLYDKHAHAYQLVCQDDSQTDAKCESPSGQSNQRSMAICQNLGWTKGDGNFERQCLTCHAGLDHRTPIEAIDRAALRFGVQCESCHGPGSEYTRLENHQQESWRTKTPQEKSDLGMRDLTSPSIAAQVCYSCHIGDLEQNRFVTHPMYAAGHPPLPPVDLQIFLDAMPPHWKVLQEKPLLPQDSHDRAKSFAKQTEYYQAHFGADQASEAAIQAWGESYHRTQRSLIGGLVANDTGMRLVLDAAEKPELWGDFAIYDCTGCHHELRKTLPRWRPLDQTPGRAYPAMWWSLDYDAAFPITQLASPNMAKDFLAAFDHIPFGDRKRLIELKPTQIGALQSRLASRQVEERKPMTEQDVRAWLVHLYETRREMIGDYATAKQTAWMFQVAIEELVEHRAIPAVPSLGKIEELSKELGLNLRIDPKASVLDHQEKTLAQANAFNAQRCQQWLEELIHIVAPQPGVASNSKRQSEF